ncbi:2,4-dienoyl-CoA reductase [Thermosyntropha lipolytica DSM 11003]|uniref:2,4-dienoyl-CoA reductase n=1 Tax=Thermosyntropha lipolytica DSM 11003 TaxID=1123382 RepID=A0A1M5QCL0_9FIRM|nr:FAD-dependent oxidoreductase [Thermosyntropha lipolytica]SHH11601.1 2,4-dienoyl-CoA reductase [Thermosyntropha lipolytica DSM 11003]
MELGKSFALKGKYFKNRIVMPPMGTGLASITGEVTEAMLAYYERRAKGGAGTIIVEIACVDDPVGRASLTQLCIDKPGYIAGLRELSERIKSYGCNAFIQLHHAGRQTTPVVTGGKKPVAPSPIPCKFMRAEPEELDREEIGRIRNKFVRAAWYAARAGFDGVELHAAHGYLLSQFLSPYTNKREDEYGGSLENRARLLTEIIEDIKGLAPELIIAVRFNVADFVPGGLEVEEGVKLAVLLEKAGADLLDVSCGIYESGHTSIETPSFKPGWRMEMVRRVKENVGIPVIGGGNLRSPEEAEYFLREGYADFIWIGRGMLADPFWANKALTGKRDDIRPCISCNTCIDSINNGWHIRCAVNPRTGRETVFREKAELNGIRVVVVGGGPAGMQAAWTIKKAGGDVILLEAGDELGGKLDIASRPPYKERISLLNSYLQKKLKEAGVKVMLNTPFSGRIIEELAPQVLVWAAGAMDRVPDIEGIEKVRVSFLEEVLSRETPVKGEKILIIGGGSSGCETADYLAPHNEVIIVEKTDMLAKDLENMTRLELLARLKAKGVKVYKGVEIEKIEDDGVYLRGEAGVIQGIDRIILSCGYQENWPPYEYTKPFAQCYIIGDAKKPRDIASALYEAEFIVYDLYNHINQKNWE